MMTADGLVTQGARALAAIVWISYSWNNPASAPEVLTAEGLTTEDDLQCIGQMAAPMNCPWKGAFLSKIFHGYISVAVS